MATLVLTEAEAAELERLGQCDVAPLSGVFPSQAIVNSPDGARLDVLITPITYTTRGPRWIVTRTFVRFR